jgi:hypothetical protein
MNIISDKEVERAIRYLEQTDLEVADWKVAVMRAEHMVDVTESTVYQAASGSIEDRKRFAKASPEVMTKQEELFRAVRNHEMIRAKRKRAELMVELWRTLSANRRQGNIT